MALHNSHTQDGSGPLMGVIRTNGYGLAGLHDEGLYNNTNDFILSSDYLHSAAWSGGSLLGRLQRTVPPKS